MNQNHKPWFVRSEPAVKRNPIDMAARLIASFEMYLEEPYPLPVVFNMAKTVNDNNNFLPSLVIQ